MSEKKAKESRRQEADAKKPTMQVTIDVYEGLNVVVRNFPKDHNVAMAILLNATMQLSTFFMHPPPEESNILLARPAASPSDVLQMAKGIK